MNKQDLIKIIDEQIATSKLLESKRLLEDNNTFIECLKPYSMNVFTIHFTIDSLVDVKKHIRLSKNKNLYVTVFLFSAYLSDNSICFFYLKKNIIENSIYQLDPNTIPSTDICSYLNNYIDILPNTIKNYLLLQ